MNECVSKLYKKKCVGKIARTSQLGNCQRCLQRIIKTNITTIQYTNYDQ